MASTPAVGRIPPHNDDAERAVLGAVLLSANAFSEVSEVLRKEDFYKSGHQVLFDAILMFHQEHSSQTIDLITITEFLRSKNLLDLSGGMSYIASLTSDVPTTANAVYYANIVRSHSLRRSLLELSGKLQLDVFDESLRGYTRETCPSKNLCTISDGRSSVVSTINDSCNHE